MRPITDPHGARHRLPPKSSQLNALRRYVGVGATLALVTMALIKTPEAQAPSVFAIDLGSSFDTCSEANAISDAGQVVGDVCGRHAFSWTLAGGTVDLGSLGGSSSFAVAVNNGGQVVGYSDTPNPIPGEPFFMPAPHGFLWTSASGMIDLGTLGNCCSRASAVNSRGQVVGSVENYIAGQFDLQHAFFWSPTDGMVDLGTLGGRYSAAVAINDQGEVVGYSSTAGDLSYRAFLWTARDGMRDLGTLRGFDTYSVAINSKGDVVGSSDAAGPSNFSSGHGFLWTVMDGMRDLGTLGGPDSYSYANAVNNKSEVVGYGLTAQRECSPGVASEHAFVWTAMEGMRDLGSLGGCGSYASAVNDRGQVIGWSDSNTATGFVHPFVWTPESGMTDLGTLDADGNAIAVAINARGQAVGYSEIVGGTYQSRHATLWQIDK